ncbi:MAG: BlaI/MecI/CopY family transcriptional regulator [bacterium]|nr:BlaI/MecI/CopY family transcriptional regulator [bacterium]
MKKTNTQLLFKVEKTLGPLEHEVMKAVWDKDKTTVREMLLYLQNKKNFAYTTIMTIMDNLYKKGFLARKKIKKSYCYSPINRKKYVIAVSLVRVFQELSKDYGTSTVLYHAVIKHGLHSVLSTSLFPKAGRRIRTYRVPVGYGISLTLLLAFLGLSAYDLLQNLRFFGAFDYLGLLVSDLASSSSQLQLFISAIFESLPIINILTTAVSFILIVLMVKKLSKNLGGIIS